MAYAALLFTMILTIPVPYTSKPCPIFHCQVCGGEKKREKRRGEREKEEKKKKRKKKTKKLKRSGDIVPSLSSSSPGCVLPLLNEQNY